MGRPHALLPVVLLPLLAGCPYVFGPPDLDDSESTSPVPGTPGDADADADADTDTDTDTDTDPTTGTPTGTPTGTTAGTTGGLPTGTTTNPGNSPPTIVDIQISWQFDAVNIVVTIDDPDGDLNGGTILVDDGLAPPQVLSIPSDLASWNPGAGLATIVVPWTVDCGGDVGAWTVQVTDFAGHQSGLVADSVAVLGITHGEGVDPTPAGLIALPAVLCGTLSNNSDSDEVSFSTLGGGAWTFTLDDLAVPAEARDLELRDGTNAVVATATSPNDPDSLSHVLQPNETYTFRVYAPGGGPGSDWMVAVHE